MCDNTYKHVNVRDMVDCISIIGLYIFKEFKTRKMACTQEIYSVIRINYILLL